MSLNKECASPETGPGGASPPPAAGGSGEAEERSVLEQLLHALNQPLTGLQCSLEVALAAPRTAEQYSRTLQEGIELTGRLRALVGAVREVTTGRELVLAQSGPRDSIESFELPALVDAAIDELAPVARAAKVRIVRDFSSTSRAPVRSRRATLSRALFRLLEAAVSLAEPGSAVGVAIDGQSPEVAMRIRWTTAEPSGPLSLAEVGVLVAQAALERAGARAELQRIQHSRSMTIRLPLSASGPSRSV
jgi:hypothetical protein